MRYTRKSWHDALAQLTAIQRDDIAVRRMNRMSPTKISKVRYISYVINIHAAYLSLTTLKRSSLDKGYYWRSGGEYTIFDWVFYEKQPISWVHDLEDHRRNF